jgi:hypothetical protein
MKSASSLPKLFRWLFTILVVCTAVAAVAVIGVMIADPSLPPDAHFGPVKREFLGHPAEITLQPAAGQEPVLNVRAVNGAVTITVDKPAGMIALLKRYGLPLMLIYAVFFTALFELLRRLFRNVGRGDSFTPQSVRLVQIIGGSLMVFSLIAGLGEMWFIHAAYDHFAQHTQIAVSGTPLHLPPAGPHGFRIRFDSVFFSGLLVLALAEVFRQGLALKRDSDLTV